jgi:hypothetical protein
MLLPGFAGATVRKATRQNGIVDLPARFDAQE